MASASEQELTDALIEGYHVAGKKAGYWGHRFLQAVRRNGGLATVQRMLLPRNQQQRKGLDALLEAGHPELTVEAIILQDRFRGLFTESELQTAAERLGEYAKQLKAIVARPPGIYPDELAPGRQYSEGARKYVRVNAYERNAKARSACIAHHGYACAACGMTFEQRYGSLGKEFIHVHHLKPLALTDGTYIINPVQDLRPVCPNCHAMLHRSEPPLSIEELRTQMGGVDG
jgi:5-methylcytosine-specific restriction enzyme A